MIQTELPPPSVNARGSPVREVLETLGVRVIFRVRVRVRARHRVRVGVCLPS